MTTARPTSHPLEQAMADALAAATVGPERELKIAADACQGTEVRAAFLRAFLLEEIPNSKLPIGRFQLSGATIVDQFDLRGTELKFIVRFLDCVFREKINLSDTRLIGCELISGSAPEIFADRLNAEGSLQIGAHIPGPGPVAQPVQGRPFTITEQVRLCGARIRGNLDLRGCKLVGTQVPLFADGLTVESHVLLSNGFEANGEVRLNGSQIHRNLDCSGGVLRNARGYSLSAAGALIKGSVHLKKAWPSDVNPDATFTSVGTVRFDGAAVDGDFNCAGGRFMATAFADPDWSLETGSDDDLDAVRAVGAEVAGDVLLGDSVANGALKLYRVRVKGDLDCSNARFHNPFGDTLAASGANISGDVYLASRSDDEDEPLFESRGTIRFDSATIGGTLDCSGARLTAPQFPNPGWSPETGSFEDIQAFLADGLQVSDLLFAEGFCANGIVSLISVRVGGDFNCDWAEFNFAGEDALIADGIIVSGTTFLTGGTSTNGVLRFVQAAFKQGLYFENIVFDRSGLYRNLQRGFLENASSIELERSRKAVCGIYARLAEVGGKFQWRSIYKLPVDTKENYPFWLYLVGSKADRLEDNQAAWDEPDRFDVAGCTYGSIAGLTSDIDWRLRSLDSQYAPLNKKDWKKDVKVGWAVFWGQAAGLSDAIARFSPQPYLQLAKIARQAGYEEAASRILVRLERNRTRYSDFGRLRQFGRHVLDSVLKYGFSRSRPIVILLVWALFSAACFQVAHWHHRIVATSSPPHGTFNALIYSIDTLIPIVDLNQKKNWTVEPLSFNSRVIQARPVRWYGSVIDALYEFPTGAGFLLFFNTFFGWAMTTFFAAGVSGLLRTGRET